jgi:heat-inducible transcriptional repressor
VAPPREAATVRLVQAVQLDGQAVLVVAVLSDGSVKKAVMEGVTGVGDAQLAVVGAHLTHHFLGQPLEANVIVPSTGDEATDRAVAQARHALERTVAVEPEQLFVGGAAQMATTFDAIETVRRVLAILEQQYVLVTLLRQAIHDDRLTVSIGAEHGVEPLSQCSIIVAPYEYDGTMVGTIGVLGPTRMNYPQAMAAVGVVSQRLGRALREG